MNCSHLHDARPCSVIQQGRPENIGEPLPKAGDGEGDGEGDGDGPSAELPQRPREVGSHRRGVPGLHLYVHYLALRVAHEDRVGVEAVVVRYGVRNPSSRVVSTEPRSGLSAELRGLPFSFLFLFQKKYKKKGHT